MYFRNSLAEGWPDVLITLDQDTKIKSIEGDMHCLWGYEPSEAIGLEFSFLLDQRDYAQFNAFFKDPGNKKLICTAHGAKKSKSLFPIQIHLTRYADEYRIWVRNSNEIKKARQSKKNIPDLLLPIIRHEIKNPLNSIIGLSNMLQQKEPREDQKELLQTLKFSTESLQVLVEDIADFSSLEEGTLKIENKDFDIRLLINNIKVTYQQLAAAKGIDFKVSIDDSVPLFINGDASRLSQILYNLIGNAFKFTHHGSVQLQVSSGLHGSKQLIIKVKDTGIGIAEDKIDRIFLPFEQADKETAKKYGGTGLGLSISKRLIQLLGGSLSVATQPDKGSIFTIVIPFKPAKGSRAILNDVKKCAQLNNTRLLYIEDLQSNQVLMREYCSRMQIRADFAGDAREAILKLEKNKYDIVLLDLNLPDEDGFSFASKIRKMPNFNNSTPIIAVTADHVAQENFIANGINDIIMKPVDSDELFLKLEKHCECCNSKTKPANNVNFSMLDSLYGNKPDEYKSLLQLMKQEYNQFEKALYYALQHKESEQCRKIIHGMRSNLMAIEMTDFIEYLDEMKAYKLKKNETLPPVLEKLSGYFAQIEELLNNKIGELEG